MHMIDVMNKLKEIAESGYDNEDIQRGIDAAATQKFDEESVMERDKQKKMKREDQKLDNDEQDEEDIHPEWEAALAAAAKKRANDPTVKANDAAEKAFGGTPLYDPEGKPQFSSNWKPIRKPKPKNSDVAVDAVEEVHEEVEEDTSLADMLRLAGRSGVMGMNQNNLLSESVYHELDEADLEEARYETDEVKAIIAKHLGTARPLTDADMDNSELHQDLYDYFVSSGDMPYGTAKARDDDPYEWIFNRLDQLGMVESVTEAEEVEVGETVEVPVSALSELMRLAGYENYESKINEYENDPEEEYMDVEDQMIGLSGGLNGPKKAYAAAAGGDNAMAQEPTEIEESLEESFFKEYSQMIEDLKSEDLKDLAGKIPGVGGASKANNQELDIGINKPQKKQVPQTQGYKPIY